MTSDEHIVIRVYTLVTRARAEKHVLVSRGHVAALESGKEVIIRVFHVVASADADADVILTRTNVACCVGSNDCVVPGIIRRISDVFAYEDVVIDATRGVRHGLVTDDHVVSRVHIVSLCDVCGDQYIIARINQAH